MALNFEQTKNSKAIITTIVIHSLLLLLAFYFVFDTPVRANIDELGMEVNLGTSDDGSDDDQPEDPNDPAPLELANNAQEKLASNTTEEISDKTHTDDANENSVAINKSEKVKEKNNITPTPKNNNSTTKPKVDQTSKSNHTAPPVQNPKYSYTNGAGQGGNQAANTKDGTSQGNGTGNGDKGVPGGTPGAENYEGKPGKGSTLLDYTLENRFIAGKPSNIANFSKAGVVKVQVKVNRKGQVTSWSFISGGNDELRNIVSQKMKDVSFNSSATAPIEQIGTIKFNFKTGK